MVCDKNKFLENDSELEAGRRLVQTGDEEIVISGISGNFPDADGMQEFAQKLFNKVDLISDDDRRWKLDHPEIPQRTGKLKQVNKFDASSFGIHYNQAHSMDPMTRILLEKSYEAIIDSGFNPASLKGSKTGVFVGACFSESEKTWFYEKLQVDGFGVTGCVRTMLANRISYAFGLDGPSYIVDTACSSSMYALEQGYNAIREGHCDAAIIGGCNLCLHPYVSLQFARLGVLSLDGKCKVFDDAANGYCRSEAIAVIVLQKRSSARRIYATLVHVKTNCDGYKEQGITYPSGEMQQRLLRDFYDECLIDPSSLSWIEAHGTGTKVGDPEEVRALYNIFCKNRKTPLKIGSVKSNLGHTEPTSGMCSIAKVIIAMETGLIPPNINFKSPRSDIEYFHNGEMQVVTEPTPWEGGMVGVNSFGFGGANCHALFRWNEKTKKNGGLPEDDIPRLVNISGRTNEAVDTILSYLENSSVDKELIKLLHDIQNQEIPSHLYRGFIILDKNGHHSKKEMQYFGMRKPLWFVFSGFTNQWKPFDESLLQFPVFLQTLTKLSNALSLDVVALTQKNSIANLAEYFVALTAIQIAFIDLLKSIGITPDGLIGISIGDLACAYADGSLTAEETILASYNLARGLLQSVSSKSLVKIDGINNVSVPGVNVVLNGATSCIISDLSNNMKKFISGQKNKDITVSEINPSYVAIHSEYSSAAENKILGYVGKIIKNQKQKSDKWISASGEFDYFNAEFLCKNLLNPLDLNKAYSKVPSDAVILNITPHGILDISRAPHVNIMEQSGIDNCSSFLTSLGRLFMEGIDSHLDNLYPKVEYPVSRATPMIAPLIRWDHSEDWYVTSYRLQKKIKSGERMVSVSLNDDESEYISGHVIDGRNLYPATGYLQLVWETVGLIKGEHCTEVPVVFENVRFLRATNLSKDGTIDFTIIVQKASGNFEVVEGGASIVTGRVYVPEDTNQEMTPFDCPVYTDKECKLSGKDIYKELKLRGYNYKGLFRSLVGISPEEGFGKVTWHKNWVAFMDNMLQMQIFHNDSRGLFVPTSIDRVVIDGRKHVQAVLSLPEDNKDVAVYVYKDLQLIKSGGVEIRGLRANAIPKRKQLGEAVLEDYIFVPNFTKNEVFTLEEILRIFMQMILENETTLNVKAVELTKDGKNLLALTIVQALLDLPLIQTDITILGNPSNITETLPTEVVIDDRKINNDQSLLLVVANGLLDEENKNEIHSCLEAIKPGGFIICREAIGAKLKQEKLVELSSHICNNEQIMLLRKQISADKGTTEVIQVCEDNYTWLEKAQSVMKSKEISKVLYISDEKAKGGVIGFVNCLRKEPEGSKARCVLLMDKNIPEFSLKEKFYQNQLSKDMATNVYKNGEWGTYKHLKLNKDEKTKVGHIYANTLVRGDLSSFSWLQGKISERTCNDPKADIVHVKYSTLNFRDVMLATGKLAPEAFTKSRLNQDCVIGFEYSGILPTGKRIMGLVTSASLASVIKYDPSLAWDVPDSWSLEDAATVPCVYGTVVYALYVRGALRKGDSILIHAGTGGVGQAAIHICLNAGCTIFTTVGTPEKREFIRKTFPQISDRHIGNSRNTSFEQMIMRETKGKGVDIVLNSLAEEKLLASARCLATGGRFLEIGKFDLTNNNPLGMEFFLKGASFHGILLDGFFDTEDSVKQRLQVLLQKAINCGAVKPLCRTVFSYDKIESAFRYMAAGKHIGKVLIDLGEDPSENIRNNTPRLYDAEPRFYCNPDKTYIVVGGLGGFGLELTDWLVLRGAKTIIITSRRGVTTGYQDSRIGVWKSYGISVNILTTDVTTYEGAKSLLETAGAIGPPVGGIFNLAVVLKDAIFENQNEQNFKLSLAPKAHATKYLDELTRVHCPELEQFVVFSSVSCGRGNAGQTNYGLANSIMERICEERGKDGLPGIAIQWGVVGDVGIVAEMQEDNIEIVIGGTLQQRITSCLEVMDHFLMKKNGIFSSMVVAEKKYGASSSDNIVDTVVNILGIRDLKTVSFHSTLAELGMDSMMAVEIKQTLEREFEVFLSPQDIRGMTIAKLQDIASAKEESGEEVESDKKEDQKNVSGINFDHFIIQMLPEESDTFEARIDMPYLKNSDSCANQRDPVFLVPGIEGFCTVFKSMAEQFLFKSYGLQIDYTNPHDNVADMAESLLPNILPKLSGKHFKIIGYSFGGLVTLELTKRLEELGYIGNIILLDSAPMQLKTLSAVCFTDDINETMQIKILLRLVDLMAPQRKTEVDQLLKQAKDWDSRIEILCNLIKNEVTHTEKYMKQLMTAYYKRVVAIHNVKNYPNQCFSSNVTLIKPTELTLSGEDDYGLSDICKKPVPVHFVEGNHLTILQNDMTAQILNSLLATDEQFSKIPLIESKSFATLKENIKEI